MSVIRWFHLPACELNNDKEENMLILNWLDGACVCSTKNDCGAMHFMSLPHMVFKKYICYLHMKLNTSVRLKIMKTQL